MSHTPGPLDELREFCTYFHNVMSRTQGDRNAWGTRVVALRNLQEDRDALLAACKAANTLITRIGEYLDLANNEDWSKCIEVRDMLRSAIAKAEERATPWATHSPT